MKAPISVSGPSRRFLATAMVIAATHGATAAIADEADAKKILQAMSDFLANQESISFTYDAQLDVVTPALQKIGLASSGAVTLARPDRIRVSRVGGNADVEFAYDGKALTVLGKNLNMFAKVEQTGTIDTLIDTLKFDHGLELPAADLLSSDPYGLMMADVTDVKDLGSGVIRDKECDHLAFRTQDTDWQIWVAQGDAPYPCRFTITSKMMAQGPSYTVDVTRWNTGEDVEAADFQLKTDGAKNVEMGDLSGLDEAGGIARQGGI